MLLCDVDYNDMCVLSTFNIVWCVVVDGVCDVGGVCVVVVCGGMCV